MTALTTVIEHFKKVDPIIFPFILKTDYQKFYATSSDNDHFVNLCKTIVSQQLSTKAAASIYSRFSALFTHKPNATEIISFSDESMRSVGLSWSKVKYLKDLATKSVNKEIHLDLLQNMDFNDVIRELVKVKGIGEWSAEMFLLFSLKNENIFSHGDLGLNKAVSNIYQLTEPTIDDVTRIVCKWDPYKSFGSLALWHSLDL